MSRTYNSRGRTVFNSEKKWVRKANVRSTRRATAMILATRELDHDGALYPLYDSTGGELSHPMILVCRDSRYHQ